MKRFLLALVGLLMPVTLCAQPAPLVGTTLVTTNTGVTSICVGGNTVSAPATCLGGIQAGGGVINSGLTLPSGIPGVITNKLYSSAGTLFWNGSAVAVGGAVGPGTIGTIPLFTGANSIGNSIVTQVGAVINIAGTIAVNGIGMSTFSSGAAGQEGIAIASQAAGVGNYGSLDIRSNSVITQLESYSSTFTPSVAKRANGALLSTTGSDGLGIQATTGPIRFWNATTQVGQITNAGLFSWETFGNHQFTGSGAGANQLNVTNSAAGAGNFARLLVNSDTVTTTIDAYSSTFTTSGSAVQASSQLLATGVGGLSIATSNAAGVIRFYTNGIQRWGINAVGDHTVGTVPHVADSNATASITSGFGTGPSIVGSAYAFRVTNGTGSPTVGVVSWGTSYTSAPVCTAVSDVGSPVVSLVTSLTNVTLQFSAGMPAASVVNVLCRGF